LCVSCVLRTRTRMRFCGLTEREQASTDAGALVGAAAGGLHPVEAAAEVDHLLFGNADARVRHGQHGAVGY
jgi:hypothetical protein